MEEILIQAIASTPSLVIAVAAWRMAEKRAEALQNMLNERHERTTKQNEDLIQTFTRKFELQNAKSRTN